MKAAPFDYNRAESVEHALDLLSELGDEAKILAGGQSLVPLMNFRLAKPTALIDINRLAELAYIKPDQDHVRMGALTRQAQLESSTVVPALVREAMRQVGHPAIRARGTVGGSIAHADPAAELPLLLVAFDGEIRIRGRGSSRSMPAADFFVDALTTALRPDEMVVEVSLDANPGWTGSAFLELARRHGDFALASTVVAVEQADGVCRDVRIGLGGVAPVPFRATGAENALRGNALDPARIQEASVLAAEAADPPSDVHGSAAYRRHLAEVLVSRAIHRAIGLDYRRARTAA